MKKIIQGRLYDTETAKRCGSYESNPSKSDFHWYRESLFQKKNGEFFLYGEGNVASPYGKPVAQNEWCSGSKIIPLTYDGAVRWAQERLDADEYNAIFGESNEGNDEQSRLNCRISAAAHEKLKRMQREKGCTIGEIIEALLHDS